MIESTWPEIAERIIWHRQLEGLTQAQYADKIGANRSAYNNWEGAHSRLSLDGAIMLRKCYGLSLDFLYFGDDDALPLALRRAWRERDEVAKAS